MISLKKVALILVFTTATAQTTAMESILNTDVSPSGLAQKAAISAVAAGTGYALYKAYGYFQDYLDRRTTEQITQNIILAVTPNSAADSFTKEKKEEFLRKKARLINLRKRMMQKLTDFDFTTLSKEHADKVHAKIKVMKRLFLMLDTLRATNPYETEYATATWLDSHIENVLIEKLIFASKPNHECTPAELQKKAVSKQKTQKIVLLVAPKISFIYLKLLNKILGI